MHEYEIKILNALKSLKSSDLSKLAESTGLEGDKAMWAVENLSKAGLVKISRREEEALKPTKEGKEYADGLMPEEELLRKVSKGRIKMGPDVDRIAVSWAKRNGWITIKEGYAEITADGKRALSETYAPRAVLKHILYGTSLPASPKISNISDINSQLSQRGLAEFTKVKISPEVSITEKGLKTSAAQEGIGQLTRSIIVNGEWKRSKMRPYDINAPHDYTYPARLHPMHEFKNLIRDAWLRMGFVEVSGPIVESAFWNFDALFSPQDHPTRDMQDTFFVSNPREIDIDDMELLGKVKKMQVGGWARSSGTSSQNRHCSVPTRLAYPYAR